MSAKLKSIKFRVSEFLCIHLSSIKGVMTEFTFIIAENPKLNVRDVSDFLDNTDLS